MSLQRNTNLVHSQAPTAYTIMFILPRECKKQYITRTVLLPMLYRIQCTLSLCYVPVLLSMFIEYNVHYRCVTYRQTLMNIHNGGSEFIWLSMSFGTVKYKKSSLGYVQNIHDGVGSQFILLLMTFVINDFWDCKTQCKPSLGYVQKPIDEHT